MQVEVASKDASSSAVIKISSEAEVAARESTIAADRDRANLYSSLGALLVAPATEEHLTALRNLPDIDSPETSMEIAWTMLSKSAETYSPDQVDDEYHALFIAVSYTHLTLPTIYSV